MTDIAVNCGPFGNPEMDEFSSYEGKTKNIEAAVIAKGETASPREDFVLSVPTEETLEAIMDTETTSNLAFFESEEDFFEDLGL